MPPTFQQPIPEGNPASFTVAFVDQNGDAFDPVTAIQIKVVDPQGGTQTFSYPTTLTRQSTGVYSVQLVLNAGGSWKAKGQGQLSNGNIVSTLDTYQPVTPSDIT